MGIIGWIRQGDKAACGATVIEGSPTETSHGRPFTFMGARMACRKRCVIAEGIPTHILCNGRPQVLHGHCTSGGCPLTSTLNGIDGWSDGGGEPTPAAFYKGADGAWQPKYGPEHLTDDSPDEQVRAVDETTGEPVPDLAYYVEAPDGSTYRGHTDAQGLCQRVKTFRPEDLTVWFGEDAEQKMQGA